MLELIIFLSWWPVGVMTRRILIETGNGDDGAYAVIFWPFYAIGLSFLALDAGTAKVVRWLRS